VAGVALVAVAVRQLLLALRAAEGAPVAWQLRPIPILGSIAVTWAMYAILIGAWRGMVHGWGQPLSFSQAARIWTVSSLGKYIPGKVWAIAGMALMAKERGVAPWAATGAAVLNQVLAIAGGTLVVGATGTALLANHYPWINRGLVAAAALSLVAILALLSPGLVRRVLGRFGVEPAGPATPSVSSVLWAALANVIAWVGYGVALWLLAQGVLSVTPPLQAAVAAFTASYIAGLLAVIAPGGLGVREAVFILMLQGTLGAPAAAALAIASRLLLTFTEIGAAAPFLLFPAERARVAS
jgi:uncharacterized membrane protein YbhN (UPF0104 family)